MKQVKQKSVADIDNWFNGEIKRQVNAIPPNIIELARGNKQYLKLVAESISRKCCFNVKAIEKSLLTILN